MLSMQKQNVYKLREIFAAQSRTIKLDILERTLIEM